MTGVKMGDRVAFVGCAHGGRLAAIAAKVGLVGTRRGDRARRSRRRAAHVKAADERGVLVDVQVAPPARPPLEDAAFDLAVVDDTGGLFGR